MKTTIVLPTYNEKENIECFLRELCAEIETIDGFDINILVVDDFSPDGTAEIVKTLMKDKPCINLLMNNTRGLGRAYIAGFKYAMKNFNSDILIEMDSDFSHDTKKVKELLAGIKKDFKKEEYAEEEYVKEGYDFVIGSRYIKGGSIPKDWALIRKLNSKYGNVFARLIAGLYSIKDCTSGFRAIRTDILKKIDLDNLNANGYSFQMNILFECVSLGAKVLEVPIDFKDREKGSSKLGIKDILEFIVNSFKLRLKIFQNKFNLLRK